MTDLLRARDIGALFRFLRTRGWSRLAIAAATGLTETRVRAVAQGKQRITSYDVLERVADGLGLDRGLMGLAYTPSRPPSAGHDTDLRSDRWAPPTVVHRTGADTAMPGTTPNGPMASRPWPEFGDSLEAAALDDVRWEDPMQRRNLVAVLAGVAVGSVPAAEVASWRPSWPQPMSAAGKVTREHVALVRKVTELHRVTDLRAGGGAVRESVTGYLAWANGLLHGSPDSDIVARTLREALGYLHNVAGWVNHDLGRHNDARRYLIQGLVLAREIDEHSLMADAYYKLGRVSIDQGMAREALRLWQIGQIVAGDGDNPASIALLHANEAWAYGVLGDERRMVDALARAETELGRADQAQVPRWCRFFTHPGELLGLRYAAYCAIAHYPDHRRFAARAIEAAADAARSRRPGEGRAYTFDMIAAATGHLLDGNLDEAKRYAHRAVDRAVRLRSARPRARLASWAEATSLRAAGHSGLMEAANRAATLSAA